MLTVLKLYNTKERHKSMLAFDSKLRKKNNKILYRDLRDKRKQAYKLFPPKS